MHAYSFDAAGAREEGVCFVSPNHHHPYGRQSGSKGEFLVVSNGDGHLCACMMVCRKWSVEDGDILLPEWCMAQLGLAHGGNVEVQAISAPEVACTPIHLTATYLGAMHRHHWDECSDFYRDSCLIHTELPKGLFPNALVAMLPTYMAGRPLYNNIVVGVRVMDVTIIFEVTLNCAPAAWVIAHNPHLIVIKAFDMQSVDRTDSNERSLRQSFRELRSYHSDEVLAVSKQIIESVAAEHSQWHGPRSLLVHAPPGGGKSFMLTQLANAYSPVGPSGQSIEVVQISGRSRVNSLSREYTLQESTYADTGTGTDTDMGSRPKELKRNVKSLLLNFVGMMSEEAGAAHGLWSSKKAIVLLLVDDLDCILSNSVSDGVDSNASAEENISAASVSLRQLILSLRDSNPSIATGELKVVVIGTTSLHPKLLPREYQGFPEFEKVVNIPKPHLHDRMRIVVVALARCGLSLENISSGTNGNASIRAEGDDSDELKDIETMQREFHDLGINGSLSLPANTVRWARRLACLLAGRQPADLHAVVRRCVSIHNGRVYGQRRQTGKDRDSEGIIGTDNSHVLLGGKVESFAEPTSASCHDLSDPTGLPPSPLSWSTALQAVSSTPPLQLRDFLGSASKTDSTKQLCWEDVGGYAEEIKKLKGVLGDRKQTLTQFCQGGTRGIVEDRSSTSSSSSRGVVLHGPAGCGKSFVASVIAAEAKMNFLTVRSTELLSKYYGQTEATVRLLFAKARAAAPCVLFFDDFDALAFRRGGEDAGNGSAGDVHARVLSTFLNELDGVAVDGESWASEGGLLVIVACIDIGCLDEALLRPGRLQYHIHLDYPTPADAEAVLHVCLRKLPLARVSPTDILKKMTYGRRVTPAEISGLCRRAVLNVIRDATGTDAGAKNSEIEGITFQHFEDALRSMYPELQTDMQTVAKDGCKDATMSPFTFGIGTKGSFL